MCLTCFEIFDSTAVMLIAEYAEYVQLMACTKYMQDNIMLCCLHVDWKTGQYGLNE